MLDQLRRQGASIFIYVVFGILIAVFIINFRPGQTRSDDSGCTGTTNTAVTVDGSTVNLTSYKVNYGALSGPSKGKTHNAIENLIRREILAAAAIDHGIRASDPLILEQIKAGNFFIGGRKESLKQIVFREDGTWDYNRYAGWVQNSFNVSLNSYQDEQMRELQAYLYAEYLGSTVRVSREEAQQDYLFQNNTVTFDIVEFKTDAYRAAMKLTDADVDRFVATHTDEVKARYDQDMSSYKGVKPQLKLREIFIAKAEPPKSDKPDDKKPADDNKPDDKPATGSGSNAAAPAPAKGSVAGSGAGFGFADANGPSAGSGSAAKKADDKKPADKKAADKKADDKKPADKKDDTKKDDAKKAISAKGMPIEDAKAKLEAVKKDDIKKFADHARELNTDPALASTGGDLGWRTADSASIGEKAVTDAVKALKPGETTAVIATDKGVYLILAEDKREGDLSFDQVKHEIGATLAKDVWAKEAAKRDALAAVANATAGTGKNLDTLFERDHSQDNNNIDEQMMKILQDPKIPMDVKKQLLEQWQQRKQQGGSLEIESQDKPAAWYADKDGSSAGSATPGSAAAGSGSGAGSSAPAPTPPKPEAPKPDLTKPSADKLPEFLNLEMPKVVSKGPTQRSSKIGGITNGKDISDALFDVLVPSNDLHDKPLSASIGPRIYEAGGGYAVIQLKARKNADIADFTKEGDAPIEDLRARRAQTAVDTWLRDRCDALAKAGKITVNPDLLTERDDKGNPIPSGYRPCFSLHPPGAPEPGGGGGPEPSAPE